MSDPLVDGVVRSQKDSSWPDIPAARAKIAKAMAFVNECHRFGMMEVRRSLGLPTDGTPGFPDRVYK